MTLSRRSSLALASPWLALALLVAACGGSAPGSGTPAAAQAPTDAAAEPAAAEGEEGQSEGDLDQLAASFEAAERRLAGLGLGDLDAGDRFDNNRQQPGDDGPKAGATPKRANESPDTEAGLTEAELSKKKLAARKADRCTVACRALDSMRRSAEGLCRVVGEGDPRCESVNQRAERARRSVARACPACASAEAVKE